MARLQEPSPLPVRGGSGRRLHRIERLRAPWRDLGRTSPPKICHRCASAQPPSSLDQRAISARFCAIIRGFDSGRGRLRILGTLPCFACRAKLRALRHRSLRMSYLRGLEFNGRSILRLRDFVPNRTGKREDRFAVGAATPSPPRVSTLGSVDKRRDVIEEGQPCNSTCD